MRHRIFLDTVNCSTQPERVQQCFTNDIDKAEPWIKAQLSMYPGAVVRIYRTVEAHTLNVVLEGSELAYSNPE